MSAGKRVLCVGHAVQDFVFTLPALPQRAEKYQASSLTMAGGGPAATAAVAIARLGGNASLAARLGGDPIADLVIAELESYGVDCRFVQRLAGCASSLSAVFIDERGERMIVNHSDAATPGDPRWLTAIAIRAYDAVLADTRWPEGAALLLERARDAGLPAVLDADTPVPRDGGLLRCATHVAFSGPGLRDFTSIAAPEPALRSVARNLDAWCCVTLGAEGVLAARHDRLERHAGFAVTAVDTLGAGDVWHGAFALALAEGRSEAAAVREASAAAALKVQRRGARAGAPTRAERDEFLRLQGAPATTH